MKWEYKQIEAPLYHTECLENLNDLGEVGWELVSVVKGDRVVYYFKRPIEGGFVPRAQAHGFGDYPRKEE